jgi:hypothetical protein
MVAQGRVTGGFGKPVELTSHGDGGVYASQLSSGLTYVAWDEPPASHPRWKIAVISHGHVSQPVVLPRKVYLQGLVTGRLRQVAAVWDTYSRTHYAFLGPTGRLQRRGSVPVVSDSSAPPQMAVNDRGDLAAVGTEGADQTPMLVMCRGTGRCARPLRLPSRPVETTALALADSGTATVLGGGHRGSLWGVVAHVGQHVLRVSRVASVGQFPVARATGKAGAVAIFQPTGDTLDWTFLNPTTETFTKPRPIPDPKVNTYPLPVLAANLKGEFAAAWSHFTRYQNGSYEVRASTGSGTTPGRPVTISSSSENPAQPSVMTGIDGHGNAIVTWCLFGGPLGSGQGDHGLLEATHIHG